MLSTFQLAIRRTSTRDRRTAIYRDAVRIVEAELSAPLSVGEVARRVATSPRQLQRAFTEVGGTCFRTRLLQARMARAAELLGSTDLPVNQVGARVGYPHSSQFTKVFKRTYGATPSQHRAARGGRPGPH